MLKVNDPLGDEVLTYANWGLAKSTNKTYSCEEKRSLNFCLMNRLISPTGHVLPASEGTLVYFASYLARTVRDFPMVWAAFTLAFFAFLRCNELTDLGVRKFSSQFDLSTDCITFQPNMACPQYMTVQLKSSKTDVFRHGQSLTVARSSSTICAVMAMRDYFLLARPQPALVKIFKGSLRILKDLHVDLHEDPNKDLQGS